MSNRDKNFNDDIWLFVYTNTRYEYFKRIPRKKKIDSFACFFLFVPFGSFNETLHGCVTVCVRV